MNISRDGMALIKHFESLETSAYPDPASALGKACTARKLLMRDYRKVLLWEQLNGDPWTIGYGHTGNIVAGMVWTPADAEANFLVDLTPRCQEVTALCNHLPTQCQFDALVSFAYNEGAHRLEDSTLLKRFNLGDTVGAADEFPKWNKSGGAVTAGLVTRRKAERAMFLGQDWKGALK